jgi:hypothetical protein
MSHCPSFSNAAGASVCFSQLEKIDLQSIQVDLQPIQVDLQSIQVEG